MATPKIPASNDPQHPGAQAIAGTRDATPPTALPPSGDDASGSSTPLVPPFDWEAYRRLTSTQNPLSPALLRSPLEREAQMKKLKDAIRTAQTEDNAAYNAQPLIVQRDQLIAEAKAADAMLQTIRDELVTTTDPTHRAALLQAEQAMITGREFDSWQQAEAYEAALMDLENPDTTYDALYARHKGQLSDWAAEKLQGTIINLTAWRTRIQGKTADLRAAVASGDATQIATEKAKLAQQELGFVPQGEYDVILDPNSIHLLFEIHRLEDRRRAIPFLIEQERIYLGLDEPVTQFAQFSSQGAAFRHGITLILVAEGEEVARIRAHEGQHQFIHALGLVQFHQQIKGDPDYVSGLTRELALGEVAAFLFSAFKGDANFEDFIFFGERGYDPLFGIDVGMLALKGQSTGEPLLGRFLAQYDNLRTEEAQARQAILQLIDYMRQLRAAPQHQTPEGQQTINRLQRRILGYLHLRGIQGVYNLPHLLALAGHAPLTLDAPRPATELGTPLHLNQAQTPPSVWVPPQHGGWFTLGGVTRVMVYQQQVFDGSNFVTHYRLLIRPLTNQLIFLGDSTEALSADQFHEINPGITVRLGTTPNAPTVQVNFENIHAQLEEIATELERVADTIYEPDEHPPLDNIPMDVRIEGHVRAMIRVIEALEVQNQTVAHEQGEYLPELRQHLQTILRMIQYGREQGRITAATPVGYQLGQNDLGFFLTNLRDLCDTIRDAYLTLGTDHLLVTATIALTLIADPLSAEGQLFNLTSADLTALRAEQDAILGATHDPLSTPSFDGASDPRSAINEQRVAQIEAAALIRGTGIADIRDQLLALGRVEVEGESLLVRLGTPEEIADVMTEFGTRRVEAFNELLGLVFDQRPDASIIAEFKDLVPDQVPTLSQMIVAVGAGGLRDALLEATNPDDDKETQPLQFHLLDIWRARVWRRETPRAEPAPVRTNVPEVTTLAPVPKGWVVDGSTYINPALAAALPTLMQDPQTLDTGQVLPETLTDRIDDLVEDMTESVNEAWTRHGHQLTASEKQTIETQIRTRLEAMARLHPAFITDLRAAWSQCEFSSSNETSYPLLSSPLESAVNHLHGLIHNYARWGKLGLLLAGNFEIDKKIEGGLALASYRRLLNDDGSLYLDTAPGTGESGGGFDIHLKWRGQLKEKAEEAEVVLMSVGIIRRPTGFAIVRVQGNQTAMKATLPNDRRLIREVTQALHAQRRGLAHWLVARTIQDLRRQDPNGYVYFRRGEAMRWAYSPIHNPRNPEESLIDLGAQTQLSGLRALVAERKVQVEARIAELQELRSSEDLDTAQAAELSRLEHEQDRFKKVDRIARFYDDIAAELHFTPEGDESSWFVLKPVPSRDPVGAPLPQRGPLGATPKDDPLEAGASGPTQQTAANATPQAALARYRELLAMPVFQRIRNRGLQREFTQLESLLAEYFNTGDAELFIINEAGQAVLADLPSSIRNNLPPVLTLRGAPAMHPIIQVRGVTSNQEYVRLDQILPGVATVDAKAVEQATHHLNQNHPVSVVGSRFPDGRVVLTQGAATLLAARDRGDTHLLVSIQRIRPSKIETPLTIDEVETILDQSPTTRAAALAQLMQRYPVAEICQKIRESSLHPALLEGLANLVGIDEHPEPHRVLFFLETLIRTGLATQGQLKDPAQTTVAVVGFGNETETIRLLLDLGYRVVAIEDFQSSENLAIEAGHSLESLRHDFAAHPNTNRLQILDIRDPAIPNGQVDLALFAAVVDEALETLARLPNKNGAIAITDMGRFGTRKKNFDLSEASEFIENAQRRFSLNFIEVYSDFVRGKGCLPGHCFHTFGHTAYIVQRAINRIPPPKGTPEGGGPVGARSPRPETESSGSVGATPEGGSRPQLTGSRPQPLAAAAPNNQMILGENGTGLTLTVPLEDLLSTRLILGPTLPFSLDTDGPLRIPLDLDPAYAGAAMAAGGLQTVGQGPFDQGWRLAGDEDDATPAIDGTDHGTPQPVAQLREATLTRLRTQGADGLAHVVETRCEDIVSPEEEATFLQTIDGFTEIEIATPTAGAIPLPLYFTEAQWQRLMPAIQQDPQSFRDLVQHRLNDQPFLVTFGGNEEVTQWVEQGFMATLALLGETHARYPHHFPLAATLASNITELKGFLKRLGPQDMFLRLFQVPSTYEVIYGLAALPPRTLMEALGHEVCQSIFLEARLNNGETLYRDLAWRWATTPIDPGVVLDDHEAHQRRIIIQQELKWLPQEQRQASQTQEALQDEQARLRDEHTELTKAQQDRLARLELVLPEATQRVQALQRKAQALSQAQVFLFPDPKPLVAVLAESHPILNAVLQTYPHAQDQLATLVKQFGIIPLRESFMDIDAAKPTNPAHLYSQAIDDLYQARELIGQIRDKTDAASINNLRQILYYFPQVGINREAALSFMKLLIQNSSAEKLAQTLNLLAENLAMEVELVGLTAIFPSYYLAILTHVFTQYPDQSPYILNAFFSDLTTQPHPHPRAGSLNETTTIPLLIDELMEEMGVFVGELYLRARHMGLHRVMEVVRGDVRRLMTERLTRSDIIDMAQLHADGDIQYMLALHNYLTQPIASPEAELWEGWPPQEAYVRPLFSQESDLADPTISRLKAQLAGESGTRYDVERQLIQQITKIRQTQWRRVRTLRQIQALLVNKPLATVRDIQHLLRQSQIPRTEHPQLIARARVLRQQVLAVSRRHNLHALAAATDNQEMADQMIKEDLGFVPTHPYTVRYSDYSLAYVFSHPDDLRQSYAHFIGRDVEDVEDLPQFHAIHGFAFDNGIVVILEPLRGTIKSLLIHEGSHAKDMDLYEIHLPKLMFPLSADEIPRALEEAVTDSHKTETIARLEEALYEADRFDYSTFYGQQNYDPFLKMDVLERFRQRYGAQADEFFETRFLPTYDRLRLRGEQDFYYLKYLCLYLHHLRQKAEANRNDTHVMYISFVWEDIIEDIRENGFGILDEVPYRIAAALNIDPQSPDFFRPPVDRHQPRYGLEAQTFSPAVLVNSREEPYQITLRHQNGQWLTMGSLVQSEIMTPHPALTGHYARIIVDHGRIYVRPLVQDDGSFYHIRLSSQGDPFDPNRFTQVAPGNVLVIEYNGEPIKVTLNFEGDLPDGPHRGDPQRGPLSDPTRSPGQPGMARPVGLGSASSPLYQRGVRGDFERPDDTRARIESGRGTNLEGHRLPASRFGGSGLWQLDPTRASIQIPEANGLDNSPKPPLTLRGGKRVPPLNLRAPKGSLWLRSGGGLQHNDELIQWHATLAKLNTQLAQTSGLSLGSTKYKALSEEIKRLLENDDYLVDRLGELQAAGRKDGRKLLETIAQFAQVQLPDMTETEIARDHSPSHPLEPRPPGYVPADAPTLRPAPRPVLGK